MGFPKPGVVLPIPAFGAGRGEAEGFGARLKGLKGLKIKPFSLFSLKISGKREEAEGLKDFFGVKNAYI